MLVATWVAPNSKRSRLHRSGNKTCDFVPENTSAKQSVAKNISKRTPNLDMGLVTRPGGGGGDVGLSP